jgi:flagellar assembly factor FliW
MNIALSDIFEPAYEKLKKDYKIKIEKKIWQDIEIGSDTSHYQ